MYPTAGPSRSNPNPLAAGRGLTGNVPPPRGGPSRRDVDFDRDREDWTGGYGRGDIPDQQGLNRARLPGRGDGFRPTRGRSRTPSPRRRDVQSRDDLDRDMERFRDRERGFDGRDSWPVAEPPRGPAGWRDISPRRGPNFASVPSRERPRESRESEWDRKQRFNERNGTERFRDDSRNILPPTRESPASRFPGRPTSPRSVRSLPSQTPPSHPVGSRVPSGPRSVSGPFAGQRDDRDRNDFPVRDLGRAFDVSRAGPRPSSQSGTSQHSPLTGPRLYRSRSQRGSSSPVQSKFPRHADPGPSSVPSRTIPLPRDVRSETGPASDLEEGEVVSPIKTRWTLADRDQYDSRFRGRDSQPVYNRRSSYDRSFRRGRGGSGSPRKIPRSRSPPWKNRDGGWGGRARGRSASVSADRRRSSPYKSRSDNGSPRVTVTRERTPPEPQHFPAEDDPDRPPTPPPLESPVVPQAAVEQSTVESLAPIQTEDVSENTIIDRPDTPAPLVGTTVINEAYRAPLEPPTSQLQLLEGPITSTKDQSSEVLRPNEAVTEPVLLDTEKLEPAQPLGQSPTAMEGIESSTTIQSAVLEPQLPEEPVAVGDADTSVAPAVKVDTTSATVTFALDEPANAPPETHASPVITISAVSIAPEDMPGSPTASSSPSEQALTPGNLPRQTSEEVEIVMEESAGPPSPSLSIVKEVEESEMATSESESKIVSSRSRIDNIASPVIRTTIAERRSMPIPGNASLSSPFNDRYSRKDPLPTGESAHGSTDADTEFGPKTGEINDNQSEHSFHEETREDLIRASIKAAQNQFGSPHLETDAIIDWNLEALPTKSQRIPSDTVGPEKRLREYASYLEKQQSLVAIRVGLSIKRETEEERERVTRLSAEYMQLNKEWQEHCNFLDKLMEARPPPPAELYAVPGVYVPVVTPGIVPTTPSEESSRADRRRRGMASDAVSTEAQFQEILDQLADDASRDPKFRANKTAATVPDMFSPYEMRRRYEEENDLVLDPKVFYDFAGKAEPIWTSEERATFLKRYLANPKQFGKIAEGLADKTASDCVLYYYRTKKEVDYKSLLASRRGDKKRRAAPITKGGKGSALLSNLGRQKPIVDPRAAATPGRGRDDSTLPTSTIRRPKGARSEIRPLTPGHENLPKRQKIGDEEPESSAAASPIGSEIPAVAAPGKSKMRLTVRTNAKRPRITSISETPYSSSALVPPATLPDETPGDPPGPLDPAELLPPVKRAGKRRKVDQADAATLPVEVNDKPKRNSTNSYWSVEDKKRFRDLVALHGADFALIASKLPNKSSRQVGNFYDAHKDEMGLEGIGPRVDPALTGEPTAARESTAPAASPSTHPFGRSIYDVQGSARTSDPFERRQSSEPRMGVFNDRPHLIPPPLTTRLPPVQLPPPPSSAPRGGMSIMSLLNDAPSRPPPSREVDAVSDGTVSDRDAEGSASRPSPRSTVPLPAYPARYERRLSAGAYDRPDLDRYRSSSARPYAYESSSTWPQRPDPAQATGNLYPPPHVSPLVSSRSFQGSYDSSYPPRTDPYTRPMGPNEPYQSHYPGHTPPSSHPQYQQSPHPPPPIDRSNSQPTLPQHREGFESHPTG